MKIAAAGAGYVGLSHAISLEVVCRKIEVPSELIAANRKTLSGIQNHVRRESAKKDLQIG